MYSITATDYGFRVRSSGSFTPDEVSRLSADLLTAIAERNRPFSLVIDSRTQVLPTGEVRDRFFALHEAVWKAGCRRVAFVILSPVVRRQVKQMHYTSAPDGHDRIIDASVVQNWEEVAISWVTEGVELPPIPTDTEEKSNPALRA